MAFAHALVRRIEGFTALDKVAKPVAGLVGKAVQPRAVRNLLSGTDLGHPAHPMLTDLPIGAWSMSALLDVFGGAKAEQAADLLIGAGILSAVPPSRQLLRPRACEPRCARAGHLRRAKSTFTFAIRLANWG